MLLTTLPPKDDRFDKLLKLFTTREEILEEINSLRAFQEALDDPRNNPIKPVVRMTYTPGMFYITRSDANELCMARLTELNGWLSAIEDNLAKAQAAL